MDAAITMVVGELFKQYGLLGLIIAGMGAVICLQSLRIGRMQKTGDERFEKVTEVISAGTHAREMLTLATERQVQSYALMSQEIRGHVAQLRSDVSGSSDRLTHTLSSLEREMRDLRETVLAVRRN